MQSELPINYQPSDIIIAVSAIKNYALANIPGAILNDVVVYDAITVYQVT